MRSCRRGVSDGSTCRAELRTRGAPCHGLGMSREDALREQHKRRMEHMPHLYFEAKDEIRAWASAWQATLHAELRALEHVELDGECFVARSARLFAEPHRP